MKGEFLMKIFKVLCLLLVVNSVCAAGYSSNATVTRVGTGPLYANACGTTACAFFTVSPVPISAPGCADHASGWHFATDTSTEIGKQTYAALLAAYSSGATIRIEGKGTCLANTTVEDLLYVQLSK